MTDLDRLRALLDEGTPGPWRVDEWLGAAVVTNGGDLLVEVHDDYAPAHDTRLIAAARNLLGPLLDVAEAADLWSTWKDDQPTGATGIARLTAHRLTALDTAIRRELGEG